MNTLPHRDSFARFWQYQAERFPLFKHGLLIAAFSSCGVCLSVLLRTPQGSMPMLPNAMVFLTAFVVLFLFFLQLRIADEFKDQENDARYRPERPVPRGLVRLSELKRFAMIAAGIQFAMCSFLNPPLVVLLIAVWAYMALMTVEFFAPTWLKARPFAYLCSHMLIMPLIDLFASATDWLSVSRTPPQGLIWFLAVSFFNGVVIEIGRKTWAPEQERNGVESYSADWGICTAICCWAGAIFLAFGCAGILALQVDFLIPVMIVLTPLLLVCLKSGVAFVQSPSAKKAKQLENLSGGWVAGMYFILGILPMGYRLWLS